MSVVSGPNISTSGLIFSYDMNNINKSWKGAPTTNLIPYSEDFTTSWLGNLFNNWINSTVTSNISVAPNNTLTADRLTGYYSRWTNSIAATVGTTYTFSCWLRNVCLVNPIYLNIAFGLNGTLVNYNNITSVPVASISDWTRFSVTVTSPSGINQIQCGIDFGASKSSNAGPYAVDVWGAQLEVGAFASAYISSTTNNGVRSNTQAILDLTNNSTITASSLTYASDNTFSFNGSTNYMGPGALSGSYSQFTVSVWIYSTSVSNYRNPIDCNFNYNATTGNIGPRLEQNSAGNLVWVLSGNTTNNSICDSFTVISSGMSANTWYHVVITRDGSGLISTYLNGSVITNQASNPNGFVNVFNNVVVGKGFFLDSAASRSFQGKIPLVQIYNRQLSATEVQQNFNAQRSIYNV